MVTAGVSSSNGGYNGHPRTNWSRKQQQYQPVGNSVPVRLRETVQSIKEVVDSGFSDSDILSALDECNLNADETVAKLLSQDPFHVVKRKRDKKKESIGYRGSVPSVKDTGNTDSGMRHRTSPESSAQPLPESSAQRFHENRARQYPESNAERFHGNNARRFPENIARRGGYSRIARPGIPGPNREFRVVRDNRVNQNEKKESKPSLQDFSSTSNQGGVAEKSSNGPSVDVKTTGARSPSQAASRQASSQNRHLSTTDGKADSSSPRVQASKSTTSHHSFVRPSSNSGVGVYSSSTDPVHVPSPDSRSAVGAIKRAVGVVGGRRQSSENDAREPSAPSVTFSNSVLTRDASLSESLQPFGKLSNTDQVGQTNAPESAAVDSPVSRSTVSNQFTRKQHQQIVGHQKAAHTKEWKPKSSQKSSSSRPGVIGTPVKSTSPPADNTKVLESEAADLQDKLSQVNIYESQNVIIAEHIRVREDDKCRLTFGSFGVEPDNSGSSMAGLQAVEDTEEAVLVSVSDDSTGNKQIDLVDDQIKISGSESTVSDAVSEHQLPNKSSSPPNLDNYTDIGLVEENGLSYKPSDSQQQQDPSELSNFPEVYDPQTGYDMSYFRPSIDETIQGQAFQEPLAPHTANFQTSTISTVQQQQPPMAQMYPPIHVSQFANLMPYRQFLSPVYVPQMAVPGYSGNPGYPLPSNGSSYLLMPGGNSHVRANGLKYGIPQFKPVAGNNPTGFGSYNSGPAGYAINTPSAVGSSTGFEDSSRIKYKDGSNLYVPQAETSELWIQNPRELPGLQSAPYYNMPGQTPHAAYLPSHTGHASFNAAAAQSSHMQFPGLYPPQQPAAVANPHHLGPIMGGNVGVGPATPGAQVGAYQQPQLGHVNWTTNF